MSISTGKDKNWLNFQTYPVIFDPLVAKKLAKLPTNMAWLYGFPQHYVKVSQPIHFKPCMGITRGEDKNWLKFQMNVVIFWPPGGQKYFENDQKVRFPHTYVKVSKPIHFKPCKGITTGEDKNWLIFQMNPVIFGPLVGKKTTKMTEK